MIENIQTLITLSALGTMQRAAVTLRVTQSTVSKRIAELERRLNKTLIQRTGRKVTLTAEGNRLAHGGKPLIDALMTLMNEAVPEEQRHIVISVAPSILIPWGAHALATVKEKSPNFSFDIRSLHSLLSMESLESGISNVAIVHGPIRSSADLSALKLYDQTLCIVPSKGAAHSLKRSTHIEVTTIEPHTDAGKEIKRQVALHREELPFKLKIIKYGESFSTITQLARAGFGHGLVPQDLAHTLGVPERNLLKLPPVFCIPVYFVARAASFKQPAINSLYQQLIECVRKN